MAIENIALDWHPEGLRPNKQVRSDSAGASLVAATKGATIIRLIATNTGGAAAYVQVHNATSLPADTAVPVLSVEVAAGKTVEIDTPVVCGDGITLASSTTAGTLTNGGTLMFFALVRNL